MAYDALAFLNGLYGIETNSESQARQDVVVENHEDLPPEWHIEWDERAAIMEYHGGLTREHAEAEAMKDILRRMDNFAKNATNST